jgi:hypothetical protein
MDGKKQMKETMYQNGVSVKGEVGGHKQHKSKSM